MGFFDVDYSNAGAEQVTPGVYEVYVHDYQITTAQTGNVKLNLFYTVRDDVNQPHQGAKIQYDQFIESPNSKWRWDTAAKAAKIPDKTPIATPQDWANLMVNKDLKVKVAMGSPKQNGKSYPEVKAFYTTDQPNQGRPMPQLEKAYEQDQRQTSVNQAANKIAQNGYNQQQPRYTPGGFERLPETNYQQPNQNYNQNQRTNQGAQQGQNFQQQSLPGTNPYASDNRSISNGGFDISDDDLPF